MSSPGAATEGLARPAARRQLALIALVQVLVLACWFSASSVVPALRRDWEISSFQATLLTVAVQVGFVAGAPGSGRRG